MPPENNDPIRRIFVFEEKKQTRKVPVKMKVVKDVVHNADCMLSLEFLRPSGKKNDYSRGAQLCRRIIKLSSYCFGDPLWQQFQQYSFELFEKVAVTPTFSNNPQILVSQQTCFGFSLKSVNYSHLPMSMWLRSCQHASLKSKWFLFRQGRRGGGGHSTWRQAITLQSIWGERGNLWSFNVVGQIKMKATRRLHKESDFKYMIVHYIHIPITFC